MRWDTRKGSQNLGKNFSAGVSFVSLEVLVVNITRSPMFQKSFWFAQSVTNRQIDVMGSGDTVKHVCFHRPVCCSNLEYFSLLANIYK